MSWDSAKEKSLPQFRVAAEMSQAERRNKEATNETPREGIVTDQHEAIALDSEAQDTGAQMAKPNIQER